MMVTRDARMAFSSAAQEQGRLKSMNAIRPSALRWLALGVRGFSACGLRLVLPVLPFARFPLVTVSDERELIVDARQPASDMLAVARMRPWGVVILLCGPRGTSRGVRCEMFRRGLRWRD